MALINATWKVTHAGVILLDWTDFSDGEPRVERAFANDRVAVLGGDAITNLGRKNVSHTASFTQVRFFENDDEARTYEREHTVSLSAAPADCLIEWLRTGLSDTLVAAAITSYRARVENNWFYADYTLQGGDWLTTGFTPPPPPTEDGAWRLVTVTGPPAGVTLQVKNSSDVWEDVWTYTASS
jgi:hypothetical protein